MNLWLTGGAGSGKSALAQKLAVQLSKDKRRYYLATMIPRDEEDEARIRRHQKNREGLGFETVLCGESLRMKYLLECLTEHTESTFLLDSVTALLSNRMFGASAFHYNPQAAEEVLQEITELAQSADNLVVVSDGIYSDGTQYDEMTEHYRAGLAMIERTCAEMFDKVILCEAGAARVIHDKKAQP